MARSISPSLAILLCACTGGPPPTPQPKAPSVPTVEWQLFTDLEQIERLELTPSDLWALSPTGPVRWERTSGRFVNTSATGAPAEPKAVARARGGAVYIGTATGLSWKQPDGKWQAIEAPELRAGVIDLATRPAGGVWVALPQALAYAEAGRVRILTRRYAITDLADGPGDQLWMGTRGHGVVSLEKGRLLEHTSAQGVCANGIRHLSVAHTGRVVATCSGAGTDDRVAIREGGRWSAYRLPGVERPLRGAWSAGPGLVVRSANGWWRLQPAPAKVVAGLAEPVNPATIPAPPPPVVAAPPTAPAPPAAPASKIAPAPPPRTAPPTAPPAVLPTAPPPSSQSGQGTAAPPSAAPPSAAPPSAAPPSAAPPSAAPPSAAPPSAAPPSAAPPATERVIVMPPPVPMPAPIASPMVADALLPVSRSQAAPRSVSTAPRFALSHAPEIATGASAWTVGGDGTVYQAMPGRGVLAQLGGTVRRFASSTLVPTAPARIAATVEGGALLATADGRLLQFQDGRWRLRTVSPVRGARVIGAASTPGVVWALLQLPPPPPPPPAPVAPASGPDGAAIDVPAAPPAEQQPAKAVPRRPGLLVVYRSAEGGPFLEVTRQSLPGLDGTVAMAGRVAAHAGELFFALFWRTDDASARAAGVVRLADGGTRLEMWEGGFGYVGEGKGPPKLPDAWVNDLTLAPDGTAYIATNAGLMRQPRSGPSRVFDENDFIESEVILSVAVGAKGHVWAGTLEGMGVLVGDTWKAVRQEGLEGKINALAFGPDGSLWAGTEGGLWRRSPKGVWRRTAVRGRAEVGEIRDVAVDGQGAVWVVTAEGVMRGRGL